MKSFIDRRVTICMLLVALTLLGYFSYKQLPVELLPNTELPQLYVNASSQSDLTPASMGQMFELSAEEELKSIEMNVRSTCRSLDNLVGQISIAEQSQRNAQLTYDLNEERYRNGELTGLQMNQFQNQLSNSKMSYTQAIINYKVQLLNIKVLTLYDFEKNAPVVPITYEQNTNTK